MYVCTQASEQAIAKVKAKFSEEKAYGVCPRVQCGGQPCLPIGLSDEVGVSKVKIYCPRCLEMFVPRGSRSRQATKSKGSNAFLDGAFFGTSFPFIFLSDCPSKIPKSGP